MDDLLDLGAVVTIQMARLGDFLQTTPLLHALRKNYPDSPMVALVTPAQAILASGCSAVDRVWELDPYPLLECFQEGLSPAPEMRARWELLTGHLASLDVAEVYNLNLGPLGASLAQCWPLSQVHAWRFSHNRNHLVGEPWTRFIIAMVSNRRLTRLHLSDILASYADIQGPPVKSLDYKVDAASRQKAAELLPAGGPKVVMQLGSNSPLRRWPVEYFAALAEALLAQGAQVILVGTPGERMLNQRMLHDIGPISRRVTNLLGRTELDVLAGVLAAGDLVVSGDTGTLHLATAVGAKVLALYMGPAAVHETGPYGEGHLVLQAREVCGPCQEQNPACRGAAPCRRLLLPNQVYVACLRLLEGQSAAQACQGLEFGPLASPLEAYLDVFGQNYRNLTPLELDMEQALAMALREAGRILLRGSYDPDWTALAAELARGYRPSPQLDRPGLTNMIREAEKLGQAAQDQDRGQSQAIMNRQPDLGYLAGLVGLGQPPRLDRACRAAARIMGMAAELK